MIYHRLVRFAVLVAVVASFQELDRGSYEIHLEGELSGTEVGAARFASDEKLDGQRVFVVQLLTPALEGGVFVVFHGSEPPDTGTYTAAPARLKGMSGYEKIEVDSGEAAVLYYEMEREHMVLLGSTGDGKVEVLESSDDRVRGRLDIEVEGATGNPRAFLGVRPKQGKIVGEFDAIEGDVELRKP